jgi:UDP:flavonoid glycosyltransferase YjiC (YdhE family)
MAAILYAWELGAGLGHVGAFMPMAKALRGAGHDLHWAVAHPADVGAFLAAAGERWLPAPVVGEQMRPGPPLSYADILLRYGYADAQGLLGLVGAWCELMRLTGARLVLADHAPTAVLAARCLELPVMLFSNGFTVPPRRRPLPNMRSWVPVAEPTLAALDEEACNTINAVLEHFAKPGLRCTADLFDVAEEALITFPELDHYADRGPARYWGSLPSAGTACAAPWPALPGPRLFAYLRPQMAHFAALLDALHRLGVATLAYVPGLDPHLRARHAAPHLVFLEQPADLAQMTRDADGAITYASLATTTAFLLAGKPLLLLPGHLEQFLLARRVEEMGAGLLVNPEQPPGDLRALLSGLLVEPAWRENARAFATKYAAFDQGAVASNLVRRVAELLS